MSSSKPTNDGGTLPGRQNRRCPVLKRGGLQSFGIVFWFQKTVLLGCARYNKTKRRQPFCVKQNGCRFSFYLPVFENIIHRQINGGFHTLADGIKYDFLQRALLGVFILLFLLFLATVCMVYSHFSLTSVVIFTSGISVLLR